MNRFQSFRPMGIRHVSSSSPRTLLQKYGAVGFLTYSGISLISFSGWLAAIHFGLEVSEILEKVESAKVWAGWGPSDDKTPADAPDQKNPPVTALEEWGTKLILAVTCHKVLFPLRILATGLLTPRVATLLQKRGIDLTKYTDMLPFPLRRPS